MDRAFIRVLGGSRCKYLLFTTLLMLGIVILISSDRQSKSLLWPEGDLNGIEVEKTSSLTSQCQCAYQVAAVEEHSPNATLVESVVSDTDRPPDKTPPEMPTVYIITPTYPRLEQIPELTRLGQTLMHVPKLYWIVADDTLNESTAVQTLLQRTGLPFTYLLTPMPEKYSKANGSKPRGVSNRLAGIQWLHENGDNNGVFYFADDDNSYDRQLFEEMRYTKKVSMWPVGLVTEICISTPVVRDGKVVDFYDGWNGGRKFPVDMAGFAVNVGYMKSIENVTMPFHAGYEEDGFLKSLKITLDDIEAKAENCTKVYVWHTKTKKNKKPKAVSEKNRERFLNTNIFSLPNVY